MKISFGNLLALGSSVLAAPQAPQAPPPVVPSYNLTAYLGQWYQIADIPQFYELVCNKCTNAKYGINQNQTVSVVNTCNYLTPSVLIAFVFPILTFC